jgi:hypothetical protein
MILDFDLTKIVKWLTPHFLWKPKQTAWLTVLLFPLVWLYEQFLIYQLDKLKEATINSQVIRLTQALRERYNNQGIIIIHFSDYINQAFLYLQLEGTFSEFDYLAAEGHTPVDYDFQQLEYNDQFDFIVRIPAAIAAQTDLITAFVNKYKLASKRFKVETI